VEDGLVVQVLGRDNGLDDVLHQVLLAREGNTGSTQVPAGQSVYVVEESQSTQV
jgi:hypothetical protein